MVKPKFLCDFKTHSSWGRNVVCVSRVRFMNFHFHDKRPTLKRQYTHSCALVKEKLLEV